MNTEDEYLVYVNREDHRFYLKNGEFHRENGPAVFRIQGNEEILSQYKKMDLTNNGLYREIFDFTHLDFIPFAFKEPYKLTNHNRAITTNVIWDNGNIDKFNKELHVFGYFDVWFYLNGVSYSQENYDSIMKSKKLHQELHNQLQVNQPNTKNFKI